MSEIYWKVKDMAIGDYIKVQVVNKKGDRNLDGTILNGIIVELTASHNQVKLDSGWCCHTKDKLLKHVKRSIVDKMIEGEHLAQLDYWGNECRKHAEEHDYSCGTGCPYRERCERSYQLIKERIQKKLVKLYDANIKWIQDILDIVLDNVACDHEEDEDGAGKKYYSISYTLVSEQDVIKKCVEAIPEVELKLEVDKEFTEKKAKELHDKLWTGEKCGGQCNRQKEIKEFLHSIIKELGEKIR